MYDCKYHMTSSQQSSSVSSPGTSTASSSHSITSLATIPSGVFITSANQPTNRRKRSVVRTYFQKNEDGKNEAECDICKMKIPTGGNTTNMIKVS